jgi:hypothetical protein
MDDTPGARCLRVGLAAAQALNPNGVADLPPPESEIFSVPPNYMS